MPHAILNSVYSTYWDNHGEKKVWIKIYNELRVAWTVFTVGIEELNKMKIVSLDQIYRKTKVKYTSVPPENTVSF